MFRTDTTEGCVHSRNSLYAKSRTWRRVNYQSPRSPQRDQAGSRGDIDTPFVLSACSARTIRWSCSTVSIIIPQPSGCFHIWKKLEGGRPSSCLASRKIIGDLDPEDQQYPTPNHLVQTRQTKLERRDASSGSRTSFDAETFRGYCHPEESGLDPTGLGRLLMTMARSRFRW